MRVKTTDDQTDADARRATDIPPFLRARTEKESARGPEKEISGTRPPPPPPPPPMRMGCTNEYRRGSNRRRVAVTRRDEKNARATKRLNLQPTTSPPLALSAAVHRLRPPHALHELVPPAQPSVEPVPRGVQFVVVLVVHLRGPKRSRVDDRGLERRDVGVKLKGVRSGVERRRGRVLKARDPGRRDAPGKVLKERRSPRRRDRMGTSVIVDADADAP